jgi:hypothetical protein
LLAIAVIVPLVLFVLKRHDLLLGWVCLTLFVQLFDTTLLTNLPAPRIVGLIYLPTAVKTFREWWGLKPVKAWVINYLYLLILGIIFGILWPWPDITMMRPFTLTAPGRTIVYSIRLISDTSLTLFVANQLRETGNLYLLGRALVVGATLSALAGLLTFFTGFDLVYAITDFQDQLLTADRAHGLSAEPRGLGLACAYGLMILLIGQKKLFRFWPAFLLVNLAGLLSTVSTSALALMMTGIVTGWVFFSNRTRGAILALILVAVILLFGASVFFPTQFESAVHTVQLRIDPSYKLNGIPPGSFGQEVAYRLDVFDASAMLFLLEEPFYALLGTGPGLVSLPASSHVPPGLYSAIWTPEVGINSLPFHGILLEISNGGLLGVTLWLFQVITCWMALRFLANRRNGSAQADEWSFAWAVFLIGTVFYLVQVSISPVWSVMLAIGWAGVKLAMEYQSPAKSEVREETRSPRYFEQRPSGANWQP